MDSENQKPPMTNTDHGAALTTAPAAAITDHDHQSHHTNSANENQSEANQNIIPRTHQLDERTADADDPKPDSDVKREQDQAAVDESVQHEESKLAVLPPDLMNQISQEIDQFITTLSNPDLADHSPPELPNFVQQFLGLVEAKLDGCYSGEDSVKWSELTEEDSAAFLEDTNRISSLSKALRKFSSDKRYAISINRVGRVLQLAMSYAEEEFKSILEDPKVHDSDPSPKQSTDQPNSNEASDEIPHQDSSTCPVEETNISGYSEENLSGLVRLSKALINGGHEPECCQAYFVARRNALEESMQKLGFEKHGIDDVQKMQWESLEREIGNWIRAFRQWSTSICLCERKLSAAVFSDNLSISESVFRSLSHGVTTQLLNFAQAVALTKRAPEKLFKYLDMYETLRDNIAEIDNLMPEEMATKLKTEASMIRSSFGEVMVLIFNDLESSIHTDSGKTPVPGGEVHPLNKFTMNYMIYACEYKATLDQVFSDHQKGERADSVNISEINCKSQAQNVDNESAKKSPFQTHIIKIMDILDANLDWKSKLYKDPALSAIFMMNNGRYILKKLKGSSELKCLIGDAWSRKKSSDLRLYHKDYQRETWGRLLGNFQSEGLVVRGKVSKPVLKERFKSFNAMFDEIYKAQSTWVVGDEQLQSELRVSITNMVIPAYRSYLGRYGQVFSPGRQTEKYVKYQAEDLENCIEDLFDGPAGRKKQ